MKIIKILFFILTILFNTKVFSISVTFINPGKSDEDFWVTSSKFTQAAAKSLGIDLEVLYAERNRVLNVKIAEELSQRTKKPDFVFIVNEKLLAEEMLQILDKYKIKTFLIHSDLVPEQKKNLSNPREVLKNWIATIVPDNVFAGHLIAKGVYDTAKQNKKLNTYNLIAIHGDKATPTSQERNLGLQKFLKENPKINLKQSLYAEWNKDIAYEQTKIILQRYNDINMIWAANDPIAIGALKAAQESKKSPGKDIFIGGLNWLNEAIQSVKDNKLAISVGGHFMNGACALIVLYDYVKGIDLKEKDHKIEIKVFSSVNSKEAQNFSQLMKEEHWSKIDFKRFSKFHNKTLKTYNFNSKKILNTLKK
ncbi:MAG: hypothetical protein DCC88_05495 [Spirobacillus cienkowskii]|jgi:ABC-type sugar transport system substrate-binding protein|uniref:Periplasmic binding protein domain-containing protein n=1 Tax=Spirobacillus cienkowskii TaxID=495820 RepID=A0A369KU24_9BACT|nr:MAG: hypothetical protein DCC88_05495 [Spirobacillus cienkowskii]